MQQRGQRGLLGDEAEGRDDAGHRGDRDDADRREHGRLTSESADLADVAGGQLVVDDADDQEQRRLEQRVREQQGETGEDRVARAVSEDDGEEAKLTDGSEGEDALEVGLAERLESAEEHREDAESDDDRLPDG